MMFSSSPLGRTLVFVFMVAFGVVLDARALTPADLQRLLIPNSKAAVNFEEVRESPWLAAPIVSKGSMQVTPDGLEKRVESPKRETWRLLADRVEWQSADGRVNQIAYARAPALGALAGVMRRVIAGDLAGLQKDFDVQLAGDERAWRARLVPRDPQIRGQLESIEVQGTGGAIQVLVVVDRQGEKTTTRLQPRAPASHN
jgi:hypothetical protein